VRRPHVGAPASGVAEDGGRVFRPAHALDPGKGVDRRRSAFRLETKFRLAVKAPAGGAAAQAVSGLLGLIKDLLAPVVQRRRRKVLPAVLTGNTRTRCDADIEV